MEEEASQTGAPKTRASLKKLKRDAKVSRILETDDPDDSFKLVANNSTSSTNVPCSLCKNKANSENKIIAILLEKVMDLEKRVALLEKSPNSPVSMKPTKETTRKATKNAITHQIIVSSAENQTFSRKTFAEQVKTNLNSVPIENITVSKEGLGVINFPTQATRDDGLEKLKDDFNVQANNRPHRSLLPKITIYNIDSNDYSSKDTLKLKQAICNKNPALKDLIDKNKTFDILFIKEDLRRNRFSMAAVKVDVEIYNVIKSQQYQIFIDFSRCRVTDRIHVTQCYNCQKFGHMKNNCSNNAAQVCRFCSCNHDGKICPNKGNYDLYKCANCGSNHSSTYSGCAVLQRQVTATVGRTQGLEELAKNEIRPNSIVT